MSSSSSSRQQPSHSHHTRRQTGAAVSSPPGWYENLEKDVIREMSVMRQSRSSSSIPMHQQRQKRQKRPLNQHGETSSSSKGKRSSLYSPTNIPKKNLSVAKKKGTKRRRNVRKAVKRASPKPIKLSKALQTKCYLQKSEKAPAEAIKDSTSATIRRVTRNSSQAEVSIALVRQQDGSHETNVAKALVGVELEAVIQQCTPEEQYVKQPLDEILGELDRLSEYCHLQESIRVELRSDHTRQIKRLKEESEKNSAAKVSLAKIGNELLSRLAQLKEQRSDKNASKARKLGLREEERSIVETSSAVIKISDEIEMGEKLFRLKRQQLAMELQLAEKEE